MFPTDAGVSSVAPNKGDIRVVAIVTTMIAGLTQRVIRQ